MIARTYTLRDPNKAKMRVMIPSATAPNKEIKRLMLATKK